MQNLQYPIGEHVYKAQATKQEIKEAIETIKYFPQWIEARIAGLDAHQLNTVYRPGGWTVNQVVHHCADSHMNCLMRLKLALSEDCPTIKPYNEAAWAEMADYNLPINISTTILHVIHAKLVAIFLLLADTDWDKTYIHPEHNNKTFNITELLMLYAWHCRHHFAHINNLCKKNNW